MRPISAFFNRRLLGAGLVAAACLVAAYPAFADDYSEVGRMLRAGQLTEANTKVDQLLAAKPNDPQIRFFKGVIQSEQGKPAEAIATFTKLTQDFPELPEPYNNLAVLYASQSQFDKARAALEMAIRTNPSYATAHENLGDIYAKLASQAYTKALQLDSSNVGLQPKLALIKEIFAPNGKTVRTASAKMPATTPVTAPAVITPPAAAVVPTIRPAPAVAAGKAPANAATPNATTAAATPLLAPKSPGVVAAPPLASSVKQDNKAKEDEAPAAAESNRDTAAVESAVHAWARAWAKKDMEAYYAAYGKNFRPSEGGSRSAWEADRKARITSKHKISVTISNLRVSLNEDKATARFRQDYRGDSLHIESSKSLALAKEGKRWVIVREMNGN